MPIGIFGAFANDLENFTRFAAIFHKMCPEAAPVRTNQLHKRRKEKLCSFLSPLGGLCRGRHMIYNVKINFMPGTEMKL